ncbi:monothiol glutaredoxin-4 [Fusarium longipes]|uniref:Monothiol glutaredoxin-4 n=1 Tax=Fusarium longipes TaxID=694270 RepID=A0A395SYZ4_9HYPO|nr:monothiol glutaredoxin-4 [Fusarium longipes]
MSVATRLPPKADALPHTHTSGPSTSSLLSEQSQEALIVRLSELVNSEPVMLFMKGTPKSPVCRFSRRIIRLLEERRVLYGCFNVLSDEDVRQGLKSFGEWPTFPQLWLNGELVGGLDVVREELSTNPNYLSEHAVEEDVAFKHGKKI